LATMFDFVKISITIKSSGSNMTNAISFMLIVCLF
jgi:hypothetical protein